MPDPLATLATALADRYRLERELGQGGMATVYLAEDLKHGRKVAIKVLRPELAAVIGAERFVREIRTIAALQHPHILGLIDSGEVQGTAYYVMPFVEGESLRDRLTREKQLPITEAIRIATEVASALDYAHRHGVIHRDIKPENILLHDGQALVADFGIALAVSHAGSTRMTETGMSLGTPHYMSPEQAMGEREITARSDVYALGAVTYEMLTGEPPFTGATAQAIVARVLTESPRSLSAQRHTIPLETESAVLAALEKLPADRFASAAEFAASLRGEAVKDHRTVARTRQQPVATARISRMLGAGLFTAVVLAATAGFFLGHRKPESRPLRASLLPPPGCSYAPVATSNLVQIAPDGSMLAFVASCGEAKSLWIRNLVSGELKEVAGTTDALYPFWSPDSRSLGVFTGNRLKRVDLQSGALRDLAPIVAGRGGSWGSTGVILYAPDIAGPLYRIPAEGGTPEPASAVPQDSGRTTQRLPYFLPNGRDFLFAQGTLDQLEGSVRAGRLGSTESRPVLDFPSNVVYSNGRLLYVRDGLLMAQRFDPGAAKVSGSAVSLIPGLETWVFKFVGNFSTSVAADLLVYQPAPVLRARATWFDPRSGRVTPLLDPGSYRNVRVSPKGGEILFEQAEHGSPLVDIWQYEVASKAWTRISSHADVYYEFAWSPDGRRIGYNGASDSVVRLISLDRSSVTTVPFRAKNFEPIMDWSPDGSFLVGWQQVGATGFDLVTTPLSGDQRPHLLYATPGNDVSARLSPNGKLLAYVSDRTGRPEVYVTRMPDAKAQWQVSFNGARVLAGFRSGLAWGPTGRELYFLDGNGKLMSVTLTDQSEMHVDRPVAYPEAPGDILSFDMAPDGRLVLVSDEAPGQTPLALVEHWPGLLVGNEK